MDHVNVSKWHSVLCHVTKINIEIDLVIWAGRYIFIPLGFEYTTYAYLDQFDVIISAPVGSGSL